MNNVRNAVNDSNADGDKIEAAINNLKNSSSKIY
jgi:hypothetical protein